mmetsp:Transcript_22624/g.69059  ORF Transcript_22624/g.69059 Transcript_22624/m.69059 type:complete len:256 (+) Transcript_22624:1280-2047(+)
MRAKAPLPRLQLLPPQVKLSPTSPLAPVKESVQAPSDLDVLVEPSLVLPIEAAVCSSTDARIAAERASDKRIPFNSFPLNEVMTSPGRRRCSRAAMESSSICNTVLFGLRIKPRPMMGSRPMRTSTTRDSFSVGNRGVRCTRGTKERSMTENPFRSGRDERITSAIGRRRTRDSDGTFCAAATSFVPARGPTPWLPVVDDDDSCRNRNWRERPYFSLPDESVKQKESSEGPFNLSSGEKQKWARLSGGEESGGYL